MPLNQVSKETILITGASSGIGLATVKLLINEGKHITAIARDFSKMNFEHENLHKTVMDLADLDKLPQQLKTLFNDNKSINAAVFCAGKGTFKSLEEFSHQQICDLMDLNFISQVYLTKALLPLLKRNNSGDLIFMGSEAALRGGKKGSIYCASKFALRGFTQSLREECANSGIRISLINPGMVQTSFFDDLNFKPGSSFDQAIEAEDVARTVAMILSSRPGTIFDEINLSPQKHVIEFPDDK